MASDLLPSDATLRRRVEDLKEKIQQQQLLDETDTGEGRSLEQDQLEPSNDDGVSMDTTKTPADKTPAVVEPLEPLQEIGNTMDHDDTEERPMGLEPENKSFVAV